MRVPQPAEESRKLPVLLRPDNEVPMIGHYGVGENGQQLAFKRFGQHPLEGVKVFFLLKQRQLGYRPIEHMKARTRWADSCSTWHGETLTHPEADEKRCVSFYQSC